MRERQRDYELMIIISPLRTSEEDINATLSRVQQTITGLGGEVTTVEQTTPWGRRKLAYPIRRYSEGEASRRSFNEGYYVLLHFHLPTTQIDEFERQLKLNDAVIRHLITLVDYRDQQAGVPSTSTALEPVLDDANGDDENTDESDE